MLFSTPIFWVFFFCIAALVQLNYKTIQSITLQNSLLLAASYFFYAYWDWRFLGLVILVTAQTYYFGALIKFRPKKRKIWLATSVVLNIAILGYFKYFNFFAGELLTAFNLDQSYTLTHVILPVGISFYIFQSLTYVIDIYFKKINPESNILDYFTYIAFFPQLVAGPIERASSLLPQFKSVKNIDPDSLYTGTKICIIGLFLKVFIADNVADSVDLIFADYHNLNGGTLILGALYFTIQIYGDFCGYSLIAIGVAKIIGFNLMRNFNTPYFSTSIQEFWRRWHISLSTFFRDYVYIPLGGSRNGRVVTDRNLLITFVTSGLWHGANWTFIFWGFAHGLLLIIQKAASIRLKAFFGWAVTMFSVVVLWVMFRSETMTDFYLYLERAAYHPGIPEKAASDAIFLFYYLIADLILFRYQEDAGTWFNSQAKECLMLSFMLILVIGTIHDVNPNFIYFQF